MSKARIVDVITKGKNVAYAEPINIMFTAKTTKPVRVVVYCGKHEVMNRLVTEDTQVRASVDQRLEVGQKPAIHIYLNDESGEVVDSKVMSFEIVDAGYMRSEDIIGIGRNITETNRLLCLLTHMCFYKRHLLTTMAYGESQPIVKFSTPKYDYEVNLKLASKEPKISGDIEIKLHGYEGTTTVTVPLKGWMLTAHGILQRLNDPKVEKLIIDLGNQAGVKSLLRLSNSEEYGVDFKESMSAVFNVTYVNPSVNDKRVEDIQRFFNIVG